MSAGWRQRCVKGRQDDAESDESGDGVWPHDAAGWRSLHSRVARACAGARVGEDGREDGSEAPEGAQRGARAVVSPARAHPRLGQCRGVSVRRCERVRPGPRAHTGAHGCQLYACVLSARCLAPCLTLPVSPAPSLFPPPPPRARPPRARRKQAVAMKTEMMKSDRRKYERFAPYYQVRVGRVCI